MTKQTKGSKSNKASKVAKSNETSFDAEVDAEIENAEVAKTESAPIPKGPPPAAARASLTFRPNYAVSGSQKIPRAGSKRAVVLDRLLNGGLTIEGVQEVTAAMGPNMGWDRRTAMEGVRLIAKQNGYGLRTDDKGVIHAFTADSDAAAGAA